MKPAPAAWRGPAVRKYRNIPTEVDGIRFDSKREAARWSQLKLMERAGYITDLERQVRYPLNVNGVQICNYICDFKYIRNGAPVVEDSKGVRTKDYIIKAKLMKAIHGLDVVEV